MTLAEVFPSSPFTRNGAVAICAVSLMHIVQGVLILSSASAVNATPTTALLVVFHAADSPDGARFMAIIVLLSAFTALAGTLLRVGWVRLATLMPQHFFLGIMAFGGMWAALHSAYLDGTARPWQHIATDQIGLVALFAIHSYAILRRAQDQDD